VALSFFTRIWKHWNGSSDEVHVLDNLSFYMFHYNDVKKQCFSETAGDRFDLNTVSFLKEKAYGVHLNSKITGNEGMNTSYKREPYAVTSSIHTVFYVTKNTNFFSMY